MADRISAFVEGIPIFFIGMIIVFGMLFLLIFAMIIMGSMMDRINGKKKVDKKAQEAKAQPSKAEEEAAVSVQQNVEDDLELIAVITAAIAASLGTTSDQLQVRSLKRVKRKSL